MTVAILEPVKPYLYGIDVSSWNKIYDYDKVAQSIDFAYIKATEGKTNASKTYEEKRDELTKRGVKVGAYHYGWLKKWGIKEPEKQARFFARTVGPLDADSLIPVLDMESGWYKKIADIHNWINRFLEVAEDELGCMIGIYTFRSFHKYKLKDTWDRPLWLASTGKLDKDQHPRRSNPKRSIPDWDTLLWQYSHRGRITGIKGRVDLNRMATEDLTTWMVEQIHYP